MSVELLPCPFCGGEGLLHRVAGMGALWRVSCVNCDASPHGQFGEREAIAAWNRRAATSPAGDLVERLEREADNMQFNEDLDSMDDGIALLREAAQALRHQSTGVTEITDEMIFAAMKKADELGEPLDDIDTREILAAALSAQERG